MELQKLQWYVLQDVIYLLFGGIHEQADRRHERRQQGDKLGACSMLTARGLGG